MYISDCSLDSPSSIKEISRVVRAFLLTYPERQGQAFKPHVSKKLSAPIPAPSELLLLCDVLTATTSVR